MVSYFPTKSEVIKRVCDPLEAPGWYCRIVVKIFSCIFFPI